MMQAVQWHTQRMFCHHQMVCEGAKQAVATTLRKDAAAEQLLQVNDGLPAEHGRCCNVSPGCSQ